MIKENKISIIETDEKITVEIKGNGYTLRKMVLIAMSKDKDLRKIIFDAVENKKKVDAFEKMSAPEQKEELKNALKELQSTLKELIDEQRK